MPFAILDFTAPEGTLRARIAARRTAATDASEADLAVLAHQQATQEPLADEERAAVVAFDASAPLERTRDASAWLPLERAIRRA